MFDVEYNFFFIKLGELLICCVGFIVDEDQFIVMYFFRGVKCVFVNLFWNLKMFFLRVELFFEDDDFEFYFLFKLKFFWLEGLFFLKRINFEKVI